MNMKRCQRLIFSFLLALLLAGCGFQLRHIQQLPQSLRTLNIQSENPGNPVAAALKNTLRGMGVVLTPQATYTLTISRSSFTHSESSVTDTSSAENYRFTQYVFASLSKGKRTIAKRQFAASTTQIVNKNQILTPATTAAAQSVLPQRIVTQIYAWLTADNIQRALDGSQSTTTH